MMLQLRRPISIALVALCGLFTPVGASAYVPPEVEVPSPCIASASKIVPCDGVATTVVGATGSRQFTVTNLTGSLMVYTLTAGYSGGVASATVSPANFSLVGGQSHLVTLSWQMGPAQTNGTAKFDLSDDVGSALNTTVSVTAEAPFTVDISYNINDYQHPGLCEAGCFAARASHSTVPYFSLDSPRSLTVVYDGDRAFPRPFIVADVTPLIGAPAVSYWMLEATVNGQTVTFLNGDTRLHFGPGVERMRLAGQFSTSLPTGVYPLMVNIRAQHTDGNETTKALTSDIIIVNESSSPVAKGWAIAGLQRLYALSGGRYLIVEGGGAAVQFPALGGASDFTSLAFDGSIYTRSYQDGTRVTFNSAGYETAISDRLGRTVTLTYDGSNRLTQVTDPVRTYGGSPTYHTLSYGSYGLSTVIEPAGNGTPGGGRITTYTVGSDNGLTAIKDPDGDSTRYSHDASSRIATITDRRGGVTTLSYHTPSWKLAQLTLPQAEVDAGGGATTFDTPTMTFSAWQNVGVPTSATSIASPAAAAGRDTIRGAITDPIGRVTRFTADRWGQPLVITEPLGRQTTITRSGVFPSSIRDPSGAVDSMAYTNGLVTMVLPSGSAATNFRYGVNAQVDSVWGTGTRIERRFLSAAGTVDSVLFVGPTNELIRFTYDALGRLERVKDHTGDTTLFAYEAAFGNLRRVRVPGGRVDSTFFDRAGRDSALAATGLPSRTVLYDWLNRPTHFYDGVNASPTITRYDALFDTTVTDPKNQVYRLQRNALGWATREYAANSTTSYRSYRYDRAGQLKSWTNRRGQRVDMTLDSLGRVVSRHGAVNIDTATFSYDAYGFWMTQRNPSDSATVRVDPFSMSDSTVRWIGGKRFRIYHTDADGLTQPDSMLVACTNCANGLSFPVRRFKRDSQTGALASLHLAGLDTIGFSYSVEDDRRVTNFPNSLNRYETYTTRHQRYDAEYNHSDLDDAFRRSYRYDVHGRITGEQRQYGAGTYQLAFSYDGVGRLSSVDHRNQTQCNVWPASGGNAPTNDFGWGYTCDLPDSTTTYSYDAADNRTSQGGSYDDGNRITALEGFTFGYDADGNVTSKSGNGLSRTYSWDAANRLISIAYSGPSGNFTVGFNYDASGRLVRRTRDGAAERWYLWDGAQLLAELDSSFRRLSEYVYAGGVDQPLGMILGDTLATSVEYLLQDSRGNVIGSRVGSAVQQTITYKSWGGRGREGTSANNLSWKGLLAQSQDDVLYYMRSRWYDSNTGRFLSEDPLGLGAGINQYAFAGNDPINGWDPSGMQGDMMGWIAPLDPIVITATAGGFPDRRVFNHHMARPPYKPGGGSGGGVVGVSEENPQEGAPRCSASWIEVALGIAADRRSARSGVEEGYSVVMGWHAGGPHFYIVAVGTGFTRGPDFISGRPLPGTIGFIHNHPSGGGISEHDSMYAYAHGVRVVSASERTMRFGAIDPGGHRTTTTCR